MYKHKELAFQTLKKIRLCKPFTSGLDKISDVYPRKLQMSGPQENNTQNFHHVSTLRPQTPCFGPRTRTVLWDSEPEVSLGTQNPHSTDLELPFSN